MVSATSWKISRILLLDQARIIEGEAVVDAAAYAKRMASVMAKGVG